MKTANFSAMLVTGIMLGTDWMAVASGQSIPEIPRRFMRGIAQATTLNGQPVIYYNPATARRMGRELSEFFRAHEYAHHQLNHLNRPISVQQAEAEADAYAARTASPAAVTAASVWFGRGNGGSRQHGSGWERASRLNGSVAFLQRSQSGRSGYQSRYSGARRMPARVTHHSGGQRTIASRRIVPQPVIYRIRRR